MYQNGYYYPDVISHPLSYAGTGAPNNTVDLATTAGVQQAYNDLLSVQSDAQSIAPAVTLIGTTASLTGPAVSVDGVFGPDTTHAVIDFQSAFSLTPDGIVGPDTRSRLAQALSDNQIDTAVNGDATNILRQASSTPPPQPSPPVPTPSPVIQPSPPTTPSATGANTLPILLGAAAVLGLGYVAYRMSKNKRHGKHLFA